MDHDVTFSVVQLDHEPTTLHSKSATVTSGEMNSFEVTLAESVRNWEVRVEADPDLVFVTIYHLIDVRLDPNKIGRASCRERVQNPLDAGPGDVLTRGQRRQLALK